MTFPVSDNFNRANVNPIDNGWLHPTSSTAKILSNTMMTSSGVTVPYWGNDSAPNDCYAECKNTNGSGNGGPAVRIQTGTGTFDYYRYNIYSNVLQKVVANASTTLQTIADNPVASDVYRLEAVGTRLRVYKNGTQIGTDVTDSTFSSGQVGAYIGSSTTKIDDWAAGQAGSTIITGNNCSQVNTSTSGAIIQEQILTGGNCTQANTSTSGAIVQTLLGYVLADNSTVATQSSSGGVTQPQEVTGANCTQANTSTSGAIIHTHQLLAQDSVQANSCTSGAVGQMTLLSGSDCMQINLSSSGKMMKSPGFWYEDDSYLAGWSGTADSAPVWDDVINIPITWN